MTTTITPKQYPTAKKQYPATEEIRELRRQTQEALGIPLKTSRPGQSICGMAVHYDYQSWYGWESGKTKMHPAVWELANLKMRPWIAGEPVTDEHLLSWIEHFKGEHRGSNPNSHTAK